MTSTPGQARRDYTTLAGLRAGATRDETMRAFVDRAWDALHAHDVSWVGFYVGPGQSASGATAGPGEMVLGPCRDKPACSPIGLHGACGQAFTSRDALVVTDVKNLGDGYVACDPRDASELVIPLFDRAQHPWGVLDLDSFSTGAFSTDDAEALLGALVGCGLSVPPNGGLPIRVI